MTDAPRYASLKDYVRVLRAHRILILACAVVFAGAGYGVAASEKPTYQASAAISFTAESSGVNLVSPTPLPTPTLDPRPAIDAALVNRPTLAQRVKNRLHTSLSVGALEGMVTGQVDPRTNLLLVAGQANQANLAALIANAFAQEVVASETATQRSQLSAAAASLARRIHRLSKRDQLTQGVLAERLFQLQAAESIAQPAIVLRPATVPTTPTAPRPSRDGALGLLVGLTLGILAAFLRDALDLRLRGASEIEEHLPLPVMGHLSKDALGRVPLSANGRKSLSPADMESLRIIRTNLEFLQVDGPRRSVLVTSGLPQEGKTTVSLALAAVSAAAGRRTLLLECDLRLPVLAKRLGIEPTPGLTDYLAGRVSPAELVRVVPVGDSVASGHAESEGTPPATDQARANLACVTAGSQAPFPAEMLGSERFRALIEEVTDAYDLVVIDSAPLLSVVDTRELLPLVDGVLVCVRSLQTTSGQVRATKEALEHLPTRPTGLVVTGLRAGDEADYGYYAYGYAGKR